MHQSFYRENEGLYCKLFEEDEETFVLTFYKDGKHSNAMLSEMSKECREDFYHHLKEKYDLIPVLDKKNTMNFLLLKKYPSV